jgi:hypothetical protein
MIWGHSTLNCIPIFALGWQAIRMLPPVTGACQGSESLDSLPAFLSQA